MSVPITAYEKGFVAETVVIEFFQSRGYQLVSHRQKFVGVEVDLVFAHSDSYAVIEVKSVCDEYENYQRVKFSQLKRLRRIFQAMIENTAKEFDLYITFVDLKKQTLELWDFNDFI